MPPSTQISRRSLFWSGLVPALLAGRGKASAVDATTPADDHDEIERLIYRYGMAIDSRDAAALGECFAPGALSEAELAQGLAFHRTFEYTMHNVLNHWFTVHERTATGTTYCVVTYVKNRGERLMKWDTYSRYEDEQLVKQDGRWRFLKRKWKPLFSTQEMPVLKGTPPDFYEQR